MQLGHLSAKDCGEGGGIIGAWKGYRHFDKGVSGLVKNHLRLVIGGYFGRLTGVSTT